MLGRVGIPAPVPSGLPGEPGIFGRDGAPGTVWPVPGPIPVVPRVPARCASALVAAARKAVVNRKILKLHFMI
jgi:hypothetical protein